MDLVANGVAAETIAPKIRERQAALAPGRPSAFLSVLAATCYAAVPF